MEKQVLIDLIDQLATTDQLFALEKLLNAQAASVQSQMSGLQEQISRLQQQLNVVKTQIDLINAQFSNITTQIQETPKAEPIAVEPVKPIEEPIVPVMPVIPEPVVEEKSVEPTVPESVPEPEPVPVKKVIPEPEQTRTVNPQQTGNVRLQALITIADRFRFQRELFNGNGAAMSTAVDDFNAMTSMQQAENYIDEHLNWDMDADAVKDFMQLLQRKFK